MKEICIYVSDSGLKHILTGETPGSLDYHERLLGRYKHKITMHIPCPERKAELSEAQFDEYWDKFKNQGSADFYREELRGFIFGSR
jgi:hypothetical protein